MLIGSLDCIAVETSVHLGHSSGTYFTAQSDEIVPRRKADRIERTEPIVHEDRFEAIIDRETFKKAQA